MGLLDGRTAIITGSARGIGRATAELFAAEGAQVTINDIDGDIAEQAAGEIKGETIAVSGDYWHFSRSEVPVGSTPTVGQHTDELLTGLLGFSPDKLTELRDASVIA